jgi:hypothetical protein
MTLEQEISDLKNAFREYVEIQKDREVQHLIDVENTDKFSAQVHIDNKYRRVMDHLR